MRATWHASPLLPQGELRSLRQGVLPVKVSLPCSWFMSVVLPGGLAAERGRIESGWGRRTDSVTGVARHARTAHGDERDGTVPEQEPPLGPNTLSEGKDLAAKAVVLVRAPYRRLGLGPCRRFASRRFARSGVAPKGRVFREPTAAKDDRGLLSAT